MPLFGMIERAAANRRASATAKVSSIILPCRPTRERIALDNQLWFFDYRQRSSASWSAPQGSRTLRQGWPRTITPGFPSLSLEWRPAHACTLSSTHRKNPLPGTNTTVQVMSIRGGAVRLGIDAPPEVIILRDELQDRATTRETTACEETADARYSALSRIAQLAKWRDHRPGAAASASDGRANQRSARHHWKDRAGGPGAPATPGK